MTITLTPLSKKQWADVATAAGWIIAAYALTLLTARIKHYHFSDSMVKLGIPGYVNLAVYLLSKVFTQEEAQAVAALPPNLVDPAQTVETSLTPPQA